MTLLDDKITPRILELIQEFGVSATAKLWTDPAYNTATSENTPSSTPVYSVIVTPLQQLDELGSDEEDHMSKVRKATTYMRGDVGFTPVPTMRLTVGGQVWQVVEVTTYKPGNTIAAYKLELRRGVDPRVY